MPSNRHCQFMRYVRQLYGCRTEQLMFVLARPDRYSPVFRSAALRNLVARTPVNVTQGRPYLERRRLVRCHYGV